MSNRRLPRSPSITRCRVTPPKALPPPPVDKLQEIIGHIGGEGSLGRFAQMVQQDGGAGILGALDRDGDGNPLNDLGGIAGSLFGKK